MFQEAYLTQQCLHPLVFEQFCLDGISNVILCGCTQKQCSLIVETRFFLVEASLYTQWNRMALIALFQLKMTSSP